MSQHHKLPWRPPAVMLSSVVVALCIAIEHDLFYRALDGRPVSSRSFKIAGWTTSTQQMNIAAGTAFAFLFSTALTIANSLAYMQLFFQVVRRMTCNLEKLEHLFSGLNDLTSFVQAATYYKCWLLTSVALIAWCLPLAAVFPPAALTVDFAQAASEASPDAFVPQVAFESLALGRWDCIIDPIQSVCGAIGPATDVTRTAVAAAAAGSILPIIPPGVNATWELKTELPRVVCNFVTADDSAYKMAEENIVWVIGNMSRGYHVPLATHMFQYVSWSGLDGVGPFVSLGPQGGWFLKSPPDWPGFIPDLYVGVFDRVHVDPLSDPILNFTLIEWYFHSLRLLRCQLGTSQYSLRFTYNGTQSEQHVEIVSVDKPSLLTKTGHEMLRLYVPALNGSRPFSIGADNITGAQDTAILREFSYNFVWEAFGNLIVGASNAAGPMIGQADVPSAVDVCSGNQSGTYNGQLLVNQHFQTQVFATSLWETDELASISPRYFINPVSSPPDPANSSWSTMKAQFDNLVGSHDQFGIARASLKDALEELFFNITISMAGSSSLRYNETSTFAPAKVPITYNIFDNQYKYAPKKLWLPYGIALGAALVDVAIGLWVIITTGASFDAVFSTIFRIAKNMSVSVDTKEDHLPGKTPLPKKLGEAVLSTR